MSVILMGLLLSQAPVLPEIDRRALDREARAEASTRSVPARTTAAAPARQTVANTTRNAAPRTTSPATPTRRPAAVRNASGGGNLDLSAITTICRAAGSQSDPAGFLATLSRAYAMAPDQSASLRTSCAAYLAGRADARGNR